MSFLGRLALVAGRALSTGQVQVQSQVLPAASTFAASWLKNSYHSSASSWLSAPATTAGAVTTADEKNAHLVDKDIWDEAWAYEPRFGTADNPIQVPALLGERIIGVTDPEDDTLVIWGVIREGEQPKQLVAGGEFFVLKKVERVEKVGDKLGIPLMPQVE
ncbi:hypothetical protein OEZ85_001612 [Tetradesmus obliquus]|uniref:Uncharacterized protein n=1 Tax=Tetradesmus obliquus TaxID=3088 RepID=A0ABY8U4I1_TETOB|nr:hypothetical protein OEZ85_001612 [Tetradesmus obliquus]WIA14897.1 hypothetical protein OEZ85_001612 [Tetradesmus obliquus]